MNGYLIDENLPKDIWAEISAIHVTDLGDRKTDTEIWDYAKARGLKQLKGVKRSQLKGVKRRI